MALTNVIKLNYFKTKIGVRLLCVFFIVSDVSARVFAY